MTIFPEDEVTKKKKKQKYTKEQVFMDIWEFLPEEWCKDNAFEISISEWVEHRMTVNPYKTVVAVKKFANRLVKLSKNDIQIAIMMVDYAIEKGWDTVWESSVNQNSKTYKPVKSVSNKYDKFDGGSFYEENGNYKKN